jgi:Mce-associated membrane protein
LAGSAKVNGHSRFVDQTSAIGSDAPTQTTSSVRVTLDKVRGRWLISQYDPV